MIKVKKIKMVEVEHFDPEGNSLGFLNYNEHLYLRVEVCKANKSGYYMWYKRKKYYITDNGNMPLYPEGLWSESLNYALFCLRERNANFTTNKRLLPDE